MTTAHRTSSRSRRATPAEAAMILAARDPVIDTLMKEVGPPRFPRPTDTHFATLVRTVTHHQLAGPAARAIHGRLSDALGGEVTPEALLAVSTKALRATGLSGRKILSLRDLAVKVEDGTVVLESRALARLGDEEITVRLRSVQGIGKWSADMFLMFQLRRLDVWPTGDLGVRKGYGLAWRIATPTAKQLDELGEQYHPYRASSPGTAGGPTRFMAARPLPRSLLTTGAASARRT
jgi:DNA-3-methyladenine glycosylase II